MPTEFDVTSEAKQGKNTVAIQIARWTDGFYLECQDFWRISGIERSVYVYAQPKIRIQDFEVVSLLDAGYKNGILTLDVDITNHFTATQKGKPSYQLYRDEEMVKSG